MKALTIFGIVIGLTLVIISSVEGDVTEALGWGSTVVLWFANACRRWNR